MSCSLLIYKWFYLSGSTYLFFLVLLVLSALLYTLFAACFQHSLMLTSHPSSVSAISENDGMIKSGPKRDDKILDLLQERPPAFSGTGFSLTCSAFPHGPAVGQGGGSQLWLWELSGALCGRELGREGCGRHRLQ